MARPPKPGKCVHCLRSPVNRNWDHVFPDSWYPDTTAPNLHKWQIPSCVKCNSELGAIEREVFVRIALCLDPNAPESRSIVQKALRAMKPEYGKTASDKRARAALGQKISSEILQGDQIPNHGIYPNLGARRGSLPTSQMAVVIPAEFFRRITEKIVRGITYLEDQRFIEPPHKIQFFALDDESARPLTELTERFGTVLAREPGIVLKRAVVPEDGISSLYEIEFWKQFKTHATVSEE